jgi:heat shock protein HtpX
MVLVGVALLAFYGLAAVVTYSLLATVWARRPPLATVVLIVAGLTVLFGVLSYQVGTARLLAGLDAVEVPRRRAPDLYERVDRLAGRMGLEPPRLLVANMAVPNAFALGSAHNGVVVLDRGLVRLLTPDELEGIVAHELAHVESRDSLVQTLAYSAMRTVVGLVTLALLPAVFCATGLARGLAWVAGRPSRWEGTPPGRIRRWLGYGVAVLLFGLTLLIRAHSRRREYAADDRAAELYTWLYERQRPSFTYYGTSGIYELTASHPNGELTAYLDGGTTNVFYEEQTRNLEDVQTSDTATATNGTLRVTVQRSTETGPLLVTASDADTDATVDGTVTIDGQRVGETGSDGALWTVEPSGDYAVTVTSDERETTVTVPAA